MVPGCLIITLAFTPCLCGATGNSSGDTNGDGKLTWDKALQFCWDLEFAGYSDWRLPNIIELISIMSFPSEREGESSLPFQEIGTIGPYRSSTREGYGFVHGAWSFGVGANGPDMAYYVFPVRGGL